MVYRNETVGPPRLMLECTHHDLNSFSPSPTQIIHMIPLVVCLPVMYMGGVLTLHLFFGNEAELLDMNIWVLGVSALVVFVIGRYSSNT